MERISSFPPIFDGDCRVLVLGSMPSAESLRAGEYYAHKRNAFWSIMADMLSEERGQSYAARKEMLVRHHIALYDVLESCAREGSLDSAIRDPVPNGLSGLFRDTDISYVFANGKTAEKLFLRFGKLPDNAEYIGALPSTSPAYTIPYEKKLEKWREILKYLK